MFIAAIIGSILLATPWSLAQGILNTKAVSEKGADVAMDMAEVVYDNAKSVGSKVGNKVQNHVEEQVQKFKSRNSFYDQTQDDSFMDGPAMDGQDYTSSASYSSTFSPAGEGVGNIEPIIPLNKGDNAPSWQAPSSKANQQPFDNPYVNNTVAQEPVNNEAQSTGTGLYEAMFDSPEILRSLIHLAIRISTPIGWENEPLTTGG